MLFVPFVVCFSCTLGALLSSIGNHLVIGGAVRGGKIFGHYPTNLAEDGADSLNVGRGRLIPTTPWETLWGAVAGWMGLSDSTISQVLPNLAKFPDTWATNDLFCTAAEGSTCSGAPPTSRRRTHDSEREDGVGSLSPSPSVCASHRQHRSTKDTNSRGQGQ